MKARRKILPDDEPFRTPREQLQRYRELFPQCAVDGCDNDPEPHEQFCWRHVTIDAY